MGKAVDQVGVLFVCMGNICRSPTAEGVFTHLVRERELSDRFRIDSAGTIDYHAGEPPDARARAAAMKRGIDLGHLRARRVSDRDFEVFDYILAMDGENLSSLQARCPEPLASRVRLFLEFAPDAAERDVPDPYYGGANGFEHVLNLVHAASKGLLDHIEEHHFS